MRFTSFLLIVAAPVAGAALALALAPPGGDEPAPGDPGRGQETPVLAEPQEKETLGDSRDYVRIGRQIIIPVIENDETTALMLFDLALDLPAAEADRARLHEPRIRDAFLAVLLRLSNTGAFGDAYTDQRVLGEVREELRGAARSQLGPSVRDVLILDVMRQEL